MPKVPTVGPAEAKGDKAEEPQVEKVIKMPEIVSPAAEADLSKMQKSSCYNSQEEEDGQRAGCCVGDHKGLEPHSY